jgi:hypothetical protein
MSDPQSYYSSGDGNMTQALSDDFASMARDMGPTTAFAPVAPAEPAGPPMPPALPESMAAAVQPPPVAPAEPQDAAAPARLIPPDFSAPDGVPTGVQAAPGLPAVGGGGEAYVPGDAAAPAHDDLAERFLADAGHVVDEVGGVMRTAAREVDELGHWVTGETGPDGGHYHE